MMTLWPFKWCQLQKGSVFATLPYRLFWPWEKKTRCVARSPKSSACLCPHPWSSTFPMSRPGNSVLEVDESRVVSTFKPTSRSESQQREVCSQVLFDAHAVFKDNLESSKPLWLSPAKSLVPKISKRPLIYITLQKKNKCSRFRFLCCHFFGIMILGSDPCFDATLWQIQPSKPTPEVQVQHGLSPLSTTWWKRHLEVEQKPRWHTGFGDSMSLDQLENATNVCFLGIRRKDKNLIKSTLQCEFLVDSIWRSICCCGKPKPRPEMCEDLTVSLKSDNTGLRGPASFQRPSVGLGLFPGAVRGCLHFRPKMARWWRTWVLGEFQSLWNGVSRNMTTAEAWSHCISCHPSCGRLSYKQLVSFSTHKPVPFVALASPLCCQSCSVVAHKAAVQTLEMHKARLPIKLIFLHAESGKLID